MFPWPLILVLAAGLSSQEGVVPPPRVLAACDTVAAVLEQTASTSLERSNGMVENERMDTASLGCRLRLVGSWALFEGQEPADQLLRTTLAAAGWVEDWGYGADGPDGTAFGFRHDNVLCLFRAMWDGGDISDSTYVPSDRYELLAGCTEGGK